MRAGYAGDDTPKAIIPTSYGYHPAEPDADVSMTDGVENNGVAKKSKFAKIYVGQSGPSIWREGMEVGNPLADGLSGVASIAFPETYLPRCISSSPGLQPNKTIGRTCH